MTAATFVFSGVTVMIPLISLSLSSSLHKHLEGVAITAKMYGKITDCDREFDLSKVSYHTASVTHIVNLYLRVRMYLKIIFSTLILKEKVIVKYEKNVELTYSV